jgi:hypothetical protein
VPLYRARDRRGRGSTTGVYLWWTERATAVPPRRYEEAGARQRGAPDSPVSGPAGESEGPRSPPAGPEMRPKEEDF